MSLLLMPSRTAAIVAALGLSAAPAIDVGIDSDTIDGDTGATSADSGEWPPSAAPPRAEGLLSSLSAIEAPVSGGALSFARSVARFRDKLASKSDPGDPVVISVIGDFGTGGHQAGDVAELVHGWEPDAVITVGDNNYPSGDWSTIDRNIGLNYSRYIHPYVGEYGAGGDENRFFPALGNHDWRRGHIDAHHRYFELPGNERFYDVVVGPVHVFVLDSDPREPDGREWGSKQSRWFVDAVSRSESAFQVVTFHHAPFSSGHHGGTEEMRWPFADVGVDMVFAGHEHNYERLTVDGIPYVVAGNSGAGLRPMELRHPAQRAWNHTDWGAVRVEATRARLTLVAVTRDREVLDRITVRPGQRWQRTGESVLVARGARWRASTEAEADAISVGFDDSTWLPAYAPVGFGLRAIETGVRRPEIWLRHAFDVHHPELLGSLSLEAWYDDGIVLLLNGEEVMRANVGPAALGEIEGAQASLRGPPLHTTVALDGHDLRAGRNVLTAVLFQAGTESADGYFDARLSVAEPLVAAAR